MYFETVSRGDQVSADLRFRWLLPEFLIRKSHASAVDDTEDLETEKESSAEQETPTQLLTHKTFTKQMKKRARRQAAIARQNKRLRANVRIDD